MRCRFDHTGRTAGMPGTLTPEFEEFRTLVLDAANEDQLLQYLRECTTPGSYSGSHFHELTYAVPSHPDRFDTADATAPSVLSVTIHGAAAHTLRKDRDLRSALAAHLAREPDRALG